jgi:hypothetical protein
MGSIIGGAMQIGGSLIGGGARRREQRRARAEFEAERQAFQDQTFRNEYAGLENVAEDLTVNQQASQFQAQQTDAALAQALQASIVSGGAPGGAQAIAQAALKSKQNISADLAKQEQANRQAAIKEASRLQTLEAQGADQLQVRDYQKQQQLLNMASQRKNAADAARAQATKALVGGIGSVVGGLATGGVFGEGVQDFAESAMSPAAGTTRPVEDFSEALGFQMPRIQSPSL